MITITIDEDAKIMRVTLSGFWDADALVDARKVFEDSHWKVRRNITEFGCLVDIREFAIQSAEMAEAIRHFLTSQEQQPKAIAMLADLTLAKLQMQRVIGREQFRTFDSEQAALEWLAAAG